MGASPPPTMASTDFNPIEPSVLEANANGVLLFSKWDPSEVEVKDISLTDYIQVRNPVLLPHTAGRYATKQFRKKQMAVRIVAHAFEIVHLLTGQNPIQVLVDAIV